MTIAKNATLFSVILSLTDSLMPYKKENTLKAIKMSLNTVFYHL